MTERPRLSRPEIVPCAAPSRYTTARKSTGRDEPPGVPLPLRQSHDCTSSGSVSLKASRGTVAEPMRSSADARS
jgi:hypothetical protein